MGGRGHVKQIAPCPGVISLQGMQEGEVLIGKNKQNVDIAQDGQIDILSYQKKT